MSELNAFEENISNIRQRQGVVVFASGSAYLNNRYVIAGVDLGANTIDVQADLSALSAGDRLPIIEAPTDPNAGGYTLSSAPTYNGGTSTVALEEPLEGGTAEGAVIDPRMVLNTIGIVKETSIEGEPDQYGPDNLGRTFTRGWDVTAEFTAMQTGPEELQNLPALAEPAGNGLYVAFVDNPFPIHDPSEGITMHDIATEEKSELMNATVNSSFNINFSREESGIANVITGYVPVSGLENGAF